MESLEARVKKIIVEQLSVEEDAVKSEAKFVDDLGADSLDIVATKSARPSSKRRRCWLRSSRTLRSKSNVCAWLSQ